MGLASFAFKSISRLLPGLVLLATSGFADTFYLATGSNGVAGSLYIIDPANGNVLKTIGPLKARMV